MATVCSSFPPSVLYSIVHCVSKDYAALLLVFDLPQLPGPVCVSGHVRESAACARLSSGHDQLVFTPEQDICTSVWVLAMIAAFYSGARKGEWLVLVQTLTKLCLHFL